MTAALVVDSLAKRYGDLQAVDGISFEVEEGEIFGLLGPNGAGKTTSLEMTEGLREPDSGSVMLLGQPVWPRNAALLPRIGVQLQTSAFFERLTAREQLRTFAALYGAAPGRVDQILAQVGLSDSAKVRVEKMSGGQVQRLAIACALVHDPDFVFLDEPTAQLDPQSRQNLWQVIRDIRQAGKTVLLTTHHMDEAELLCDRVAIIDNGRFIAIDAPARLVRSLDVPVRVTAPYEVVPPELAHRLPGVDQVIDDGVTTTMSTRDREKVLHSLDEHGLLGHVEVKGATLEDVFLTLTGREYRS